MLDVIQEEDRELTELAGEIQREVQATDLKEKSSEAVNTTMASTVLTSQDLGQAQAQFGRISLMGPVMD